MTKDEALRLALEALENLGNHDHICPQWPTYAEPENYPKCNCGYDQAITAIKAALEAKDEPVAWQYRDANDDGTWSAWTGCDKRLTESDWRKVRPLYTTPPPVAEPHKRKPLTDEEIYTEARKHEKFAKDGREWFDRGSFARAIEAAHGIKGEA